MPSTFLPGGVTHTVCVVCVCVCTGGNFKHDSHLPELNKAFGVQLWANFLCLIYRQRQDLISQSLHSHLTFHTHSLCSIFNHIDFPHYICDWCFSSQLGIPTLSTLQNNNGVYLFMYVCASTSSPPLQIVQPQPSHHIHPSSPPDWSAVLVPAAAW